MMTETSRIDSTKPLNRRQNGSISKKGSCPLCGTGFAQYRSWHRFCSPRCRKKAWLIKHLAGTNADVRNDIAAIKADVARVVRRLGIGDQE
jgi:hypothetical protein